MFDDSIMTNIEKQIVMGDDVCGTLENVILTIIVNGEWHVGRDDVIEANLAILRGTVSIHCFYPHNTIKQTTLRHRCLISTLHKDRRELVHVIYPNVHCGPGKKGR